MVPFIRAVFQYRDPYGVRRHSWVECTPATFAALVALERRSVRAERRYRRRVRLFSELPPGELERARSKPAAAARSETEWAGPRWSFLYVLGSGVIWHGPPVRFEFCGGHLLAPGVYCLDCDRAGRELKIPGPGEAVNQARRRWAPDPAFRGGHA